MKVEIVMCRLLWFPNDPMLIVFACARCPVTWLCYRKLPGRNVYAQMHNEKEQEMTSPVNHSDDTRHIIQGEEFIDDDLESQTLGNGRGKEVVDGKWSDLVKFRWTRDEKSELIIRRLLVPNPPSSKSPVLHPSESGNPQSLQLYSVIICLMFKDLEPITFRIYKTFPL